MVPSRDPGEAVTLLDELIIPDFTPYLLAILGLLVVWQFYRLQIMAGRIQAVDFWDRSGIRMFIHSAVKDGHTCSPCEEASGSIFLPSLATKKNFTTLQQPCSNADGCRCLVIGVYGAWREAQRLVDYLRKRSRKTPLRLTDQVIRELLAGDWEKTISAGADRIAIHMLEAMRAEGEDPEAAVFRYRFVVSQATSARDLYLVVPAYLRLVELLERIGRCDEALEVIQSFETRFEGKRPVPPFPTEAQRGVVSIHKSRLLLARREPLGVSG